MRRAVVAVAGSGSCGEAEAEMARAVGRLLAEAGAVVVCGGLGGVMEAVCRGAREAGGVTIGILPGGDHAGGNPFVEIPLPTGMGEARNVLVASAGEALIAIGRGLGTLSEIAFALKQGRRVVALGSWDVAAAGGEAPGLRRAASPREAVELALGER